MSAPKPQDRIVTDLTLSRRLERAEAIAGAQYVEAHAELDPALDAQWIEVAGAYAMFDGPHSPVTQTFGLGLFAMPSTEDFETLEQFFQSRGAPVLHEISPLADKQILPILSERGYHPVELSSVMFLPLNRWRDTAVSGSVVTRVAEPHENAIWARTAAEGWQQHTEFSDTLAGILAVSASRRGVRNFLAEIEGTPVAAGTLILHDGVAVFGGASTIPKYRNRGAQSALLQARLREAARSGCDIAMMGAEPGSASQRNAERQGFQIAYTRIKWGLT